MVGDVNEALAKYILPVGVIESVDEDDEDYSEDEEISGEVTNEENSNEANTDQLEDGSMHRKPSSTPKKFKKRLTESETIAKDRKYSLKRMERRLATGTTSTIVYIDLLPYLSLIPEYDRLHVVSALE